MPCKVPVALVPETPVIVKFTSVRIDTVPTLDDKATLQPQCMPDEYKVDKDVVSAYKYYYVCAKALIAKWNKTRSMPTWFERRIINE